MKRSPLCRVLVASLLASALAVTLARSARAADPEVDIQDQPPPVLSPRSVKLFDTRRNEYGFEVSGGPIWYHPARGGDYELGVFDFEAGRSTKSAAKPFYLTGLQQTQFRMYDTKSYAWSILAHTICAGVKLGPAELEVRTGLGLLTLDVFHGNYSAELFSPRVGVHFGLKVNTLRFDVGAYSEYLWRWFGPSYYMRGLTFGIRWDTPRPPEPSFKDSTPGPFPSQGLFGILPFLGR